MREHTQTDKKISGQLLSFSCIHKINKWYIGIGIIFLVFIVLLGVYTINLSQQKNKSVKLIIQEETSEAPQPISDAVIKRTASNITYTVANINPDTLVLLGENEEKVILSTDPAKLQIFEGSSLQSPRIDVGLLKKGDSVFVKIVTGKGAQLFITR